MAAQFYIGKRLSYGGQLCTVRYHGEVKGSPGDWLGVEWDDPARGKHSGENGGIKYFECLSKHNTPASFVRPTRKPDTPRSFVEALKAKYASEDFEDPDVHIVFQVQADDHAKKRDPLARLNQPIRISGKEVEEVGFDKIRKQLADLHELKIIILDGLCMERPIARRNGDADAWPANLTDVKDACPKAIELDLSRNLFEEWREVAAICEQLDKLRSLRVDGNRFRDTSLTATEINRCHHAFANVKTLKLESTFLSSSELASISHLFPTLSTLVASSNFYTSLPLKHILNPTITDLSLEDNSISNLSSLSAVAKLPSLRRLILKSNKVSAISAVDAKNSDTLIFSSTLTELDLSYNEISTWSFIDTLEHSFPGLTALRVSHNPLFANLQAADGRALSVEDGYMLTLARLGNIKALNYSPVTAKERLNAESYYLSLIAREVSFAPEKDEQRILATHPRYKWLCEEYGEPSFTRLVNNVNPNSLAARLVRIKLYQKDGKSAEMEVPRNITAYTLLGMVSKLLNVKPMKLRMVWETGDMMLAPRMHVGEEEWNSESEGEGEQSTWDSVLREVEIVPGTKSVGNWIEGTKVTVRVEVK